MNVNEIKVVENLRKVVQISKKKVKSVIGDLQYNKFVVITDGRRGSTLLISLLDNHPNIKAYGEEFRRLEGKNWEKIWQETFSKELKQVKHVGFKIFYSHPYDDKSKLVWRHIKSDKNIKIIHLKRKNLLRAYLSKLIALKTDIWFERGNDKRIPINYRRTKLDIVKCLKEFETILAYEEQIKDEFSSHSYIEIEYENLSKNRQLVMDKIFRFLNIPSKLVKSNLKRQNPERLEKLIKNHSEIIGHFSKTDYAYFLED